jgi:hypothetical protein
LATDLLHNRHAKQPALRRSLAYDPQELIYTLTETEASGSCVNDEPGHEPARRGSGHTTETHPAGRCSIALVVTIAVVIIGCADAGQRPAGAVAEPGDGTRVVRGKVLFASPTQVGTSTGVPADTPSTPQPLQAGQQINQQFAVVLHPVGCHSEPRDAAPIAARRQQGEILTVERLTFQGDGLWYQDASQGCWIRAVPGPMLFLFDTRHRAECFAVPYRRPQPLVADCVRVEVVDGEAGDGTVVATALAPPGAVCTGNRLRSSAAGLQVEELPQTRADERGLVSWRWREPAPSRRGQGTITVTCIPGGTASITMRSS